MKNVLVLLLLLYIFHTFSSVSIVDFGQVNVSWDFVSLSVSHPEEIWGQHFQLRSGLLSRIPETFMDLHCFVHFHPILFSCIRCRFEQNTRQLVDYLRNLSDNNN